MKISEILSEHSDWQLDHTYTQEDMAGVRKAVIAIVDTAETRGVNIRITGHFFDQLMLRRGLGKTTAEMLIRTFGRILQRGLHLFKDKPENTELVFYDKENGLNIPMLKLGENNYIIRTIVRDTKWLGRGTKVEL